MKKIGFIGAYDKSNFIMYVAKILQLFNYKVLVIDTSSIQKMRYIVPSVNPTKKYITNFENMDFAIGFESWEDIEKYFGINSKMINGNDIIPDDNNDNINEVDLYDYILIDVDSASKLEKFELEDAYKNYFITSFDSFCLKKGISIFSKTKEPMKLTKILFFYELSKEDEEYLNNLSLDYNIEWNQYTIYFHILGEDNKVFEENQRFERVKYKKLSVNYKESLSYVIQDINKNESITKIKRAMKE